MDDAYLWPGHMFTVWHKIIKNDTSLILVCNCDGVQFAALKDRDVVFWGIFRRGEMERLFWLELSSS